MEIIQKDIVVMAKRLVMCINVHMDVLLMKKVTESVQRR